jgi:hypothetical protein
MAVVARLLPGSGAGGAPAAEAVHRRGAAPATEYPGAAACLPSLLPLLAGSNYRSGMREGCARLLGAQLPLLLPPFLKQTYLRKGNGASAGDSLTHSLALASGQSVSLSGCAVLL